MQLEKIFATPPAAFRQAPFWFWNHQLDPDELSWQIDQMADKGLGGFVMHARHGLITPYLSDEWMACIRHCCEKAKEHGMLAWAYDERDWPSGPAGGAVIEDRQNRLSYLRLEKQPVTGPAKIVFGEDVVVAWVEDERGLERICESGRELTGREKALIQAVRIECPPILWFASYLDTLNPEACRQFIASTYDLHEEKLGNLKELGLAGFFTDEPAYSTYPDDLRRIPWTSSLPEVFENEKGYDLLDRLPELFAPGDEGAQVRFDYQDVASRMFERAFFEAVSGWCEDRGLQMIGHPLGEEPLFFQFRCLGNIFRYLRHQHMPGMDHLTITVGKGTPQSMTPKMIESAALLAGRERTMTETFGESGWGLSLREMKWMADWQMVHGINYFIPHAFYYSVAGRRKKDSPPSEFYQAPYWMWYRHFADYTARVTAVMTGGEHVAKIAVLYPMSAVWAEFVPGEEIPHRVQAMEASFAPLGEALLAQHRDFVVVDDTYLVNAVVKNGAFEIGSLRFEALVIPEMTAIRAQVLEKVREIAAQCPAMAVDGAPLLILDRPERERIPVEAIEGVSVLAQGDYAALEDVLAPVTPDVRIADAPEVYYLHRRREGQDFYFFANTDREAVETEVSLEQLGAASVWDAETGNIYPVSGQHESGGRLVLPLSLPPMGSLLIAVDPAKAVIDFTETPFEAKERIQVCDDLWHFTPYDGNFAALRNWHLDMKMRHKVSELSYTTEFAITEDIANLRLILDGVPEHPVGVPEAVRPLVAAETASEVLLDGRPVTEQRHWEIDQRFRVLDLSGICQAGRHTLEIIIRDQGWFPQPGLQEYVWLAGDFMIDKMKGTPHLCPCRGISAGPWEDQGYPFFSGTAAYGADVFIPGEVKGRRVFLDAGRVGDLLEVEINGRIAGVRPWPPYRVEITNFVWPGENNLFVLKAANTLRNLFEGPDPGNPSGLLDPVWIEIG
jgi:hypothetical protein